MNTRHRLSRTFHGMILVLLGLTSQASAAPVQTISGPIQDWTAGETGELQLNVAAIAPNNLNFLKPLATVKVDEKGQFKLTLPAGKDVLDTLLPGTNFKLSGACQGELKASPAVNLNFFELSGYDSFGLRIATLRLADTTNNRVKPGNVMGLLVYAEKPTTLSGTSRCAINSSGGPTVPVNQWTWNASLKAGWNLLNASVGEPKDLTGQVTVSGDSLPERAFWHVHAGTYALGVYITADLNGKQDGYNQIFYIAPFSAAAKAGLQQGDRILEVDGKTTKDIGHAVVGDWLRGEKGTSVTLKLQRGEKVWTQTIQRQFTTDDAGS